MGLLELDRWDHPERAVAAVLWGYRPGGGGDLRVSAAQRLMVERYGLQRVWCKLPRGASWGVS